MNFVMRRFSKTWPVLRDTTGSAGASPDMLQKSALIATTRCAESVNSRQWLKRHPEFGTPAPRGGSNSELDSFDLP